MSSRQTQGKPRVALLRGINVGRTKRIAMADLRALVSDLGHDDVRTLLASGNVVYRAAAGSASENATAMERALATRLGHDVKVIVLEVAEVEAIVRDNPLLEIADDPSRLFVPIPRETAGLERLDAVAGQAWSPERIARGTRAAYLWCPAGASDSPLSVAVGRALGDAATTRNWATVLKIADLLASAPSSRAR